MKDPEDNVNTEPPVAGSYTEDVDYTDYNAEDEPE